MKDTAILILLISLLFGTLLGCYPLESPDSARYAEIPREMVVTHDYVTPHLNGIKYFEKPPLFYWLQALSIKVFGVNELAVSWINAFMGLLCCLLVYGITRKLYDRLSGFLAAIFLAVSGVFFALTRIITLDMTFTFFLTAGLGCFLLGNYSAPQVKRGYFWVMYLSFALAVMTKGLIGIIFPAVVIFLWVLIFKQWRNLRNYHLLGGALLFLLIAVPWHILVQIKNPEFARFYFWEQHFLRYLTDYAGRDAAWWFFPVVLVLGIYPGTCFLGPALFYHWQSLKELTTRKITVFLLLWISVIYVFYSFSNSKLVPYLLPIFPPLAILIGNYVARNLAKEKSRTMNLSFVIFLVINLVGGILTAIYAHDFSLPAISKSSLYWLSALAIVSGVVTNVVYWCSSVRYGLLTLFLTFSLVLVGLNPVVTIANNHSLKALALDLKPKLGAYDEIVNYNNYYQDLPFYLQQQITVVNSFGELSFGVMHQDAKTWMIDTKTLLQRWSNAKRMYMIADVDDFKVLTANAKIIYYPLGKYLDKILVTNRKPQ